MRTNSLEMAMRRWCVYFYDKFTVKEKVPNRLRTPFKMRIIACGKFSNGHQPREAEKVLEADARYLRELYAAGILLEASLCSAWDCAILILQCHSLAEATQLLGKLPTAKAELFVYDLTELAVFPRLTEEFSNYYLPIPSWLKTGDE